MCSSKLRPACHLSSATMLGWCAYGATSNRTIMRPHPHACGMPNAPDRPSGNLAIDLVNAPFP